MNRFSLEPIIDPRQIGWVNYKEGDARLRAKVIVAKSGAVFLAHPTAYQIGLSVPIVEYEEQHKWARRAQGLLFEFCNWMGDEPMKLAVQRILEQDARRETSARRSVRGPTVEQ